MLRFEVDMSKVIDTACDYSFVMDYVCVRRRSWSVSKTTAVMRLIDRDDGFDGG